MFYFEYYLCLLYLYICEVWMKNIRKTSANCEIYFDNVCTVGRYDPAVWSFFIKLPSMFTHIQGPNEKTCIFLSHLEISNFCWIFMNLYLKKCLGVAENIFCVLVSDGIFYSQFTWTCEFCHLLVYIVHKGSFFPSLHVFLFLDYTGMNKLCFIWPIYSTKQCKTFFVK